MTVPHYKTIVAFCIAALVGYALLSGWAVLFSKDAALRGDVIGTWKQMATGGFMFWVGSSMGGKTRDNVAPLDPSAPAAAQAVATAAQGTADEIKDAG